MVNAAQPYVSVCPVGCNAPLTQTALTLREGTLRHCAECGQLLSRIDAAGYWESMRQFDQHEFNQPPPHELARRFKVARRRFDTISALLGNKPAALRVLDVGCSRGNFLAAGTRLGFHMEGVEPAANIAAAARAGFSAERIETSRVKFHEKGDVARWRYVAGKLAAELLNLPARLAGRGHDMLAYLRKC